MKTDWEVKKLGEVCEIECGTRVVRKVDGGTIFPVYGGGGATFKMDTFNREDCLIVSRFAMSEKCTRFVKGKFFLNDSGLSLKTKEDIITQKYLETVILSKNDEIYSLGRGAAQKNLDIAKFRELEISYPVSLPEQKRIVEILDQKFVQIDQLKQNAEKNLQNAKELFQAELTKAFSNNTWEKKKLGDVCGIISKLVDPTQSEYLDLYHIGGANIMSETGKIIDLKTSKEEGLSSGKFTFDNSMVLYNKIRPYLKKVARPNFSGLCSADMYPLSPKSSIEKDFLYYVLISKSFTDYAISKSDRAGMPKVNRDALFSFSFPLPPLSEQQKIVAHLDTLQEKVRQLEEIYTKQIANCDELKQSFLKKAFEGEL